MRGLIAIAALVASVSASAGELDGKGLHCEPENPVLEEQWVVFDKGQTWVYTIQLDGATKQAKPRGFGKYDEAPFVIRWYSSYWTFILDRRTLELDFMNPEGEISRTSQCKIFDSLEDLNESIKQAEQREQNELNEKMKGNKI